MPGKVVVHQSTPEPEVKKEDIKEFSEIALESQKTEPMVATKAFEE